VIVSRVLRVLQAEVLFFFFPRNKDLTKNFISFREESWTILLTLSIGSPASLLADRAGWKPAILKSTALGVMEAEMIFRQTFPMNLRFFFYYLSSKG